MADTDTAPAITMTKGGKLSGITVPIAVVGVLLLVVVAFFRDAALSRIGAAESQATKAVADTAMAKADGEARAGQLASAQADLRDRVIRLEADAANTQRTLDEIKKGVESISAKIDALRRVGP